MSKKALGIILVVVGVLIFAAVVLSGTLHLPASLFTTHKKMAEGLVAVIALIAGLVLIFTKASQPEVAKKE